MSSLYFVALLPEEPFAFFIRTLQQEMCDLFSVCRALRTPPHITLVPPFRTREENEKDLYDAFQSISFKRFQLSISGMGRFGNRVIFVKPLVNHKLRDFHYATQKAFEPWAKPDSRAYHPHFTIGYRDLEPVFQAAWYHFRSYEVPNHVQMEKMVLFKHVNKRWRVIKENF